MARASSKVLGLLLPVALVSTVGFCVVVCSPAYAGALALGLRGYSERTEYSRAYGVFVELTVPLERFWAPRVPGDSAPWVYDPLADTQLGEGQLEAEQLDSRLLELGLLQPGASDPALVEGGGASPGPEAGTAGTQPAAQKVNDAPRPWQLRPESLQHLLRAVLVDPQRSEQRLQQLSDRARSSAWLPELKLKAGRNTDETLRLTPTTDDPDRWQLSGGADLRLEGELRWQLDRLVFASEEVSIERLRLAAEQQRARLVERVLEWVFRWQNALLRAADPNLDATEQVLAQLQALQAASALDVLSGGWFSKNIHW